MNSPIRVCLVALIISILSLFTLNTTTLAAPAAQAEALKWRPTAGPEGGPIYALLNRGSQLLAGNNTGKIFHSQDQGQSWTLLSDTLPKYPVDALATMGNFLFAGTSVGVYRSADDGLTWSAVNTGMGSRIVGELLVNGNYLYAATSSGLYRSSNLGGSWTPAALVGSNTFANSLAANGALLLAGYYNQNGIYVSTDGGQNWRQTNEVGPGANITAVGVLGNNLLAGTPGGGVSISFDMGQSWKRINNGISNLYVNALAVVGGTIFVGTDGGLFVSTNQGGSWTAAHNGLTSLAVLSFATGENTIWAGTQGGVFRATGNVYDWTPCNRGIVSSLVREMLITEGTLFAASPGGVYTASDRGAGWTTATKGMRDTFVWSLAAVGRDVFAGTESGLIYRTSDRGRNWTQVYKIPFSGLAVYALGAQGNALFAGTLSGVWRSTDRGENWERVNNGLQGTGLSIKGFLADGAVLYATSDGGVYLTTDRGDTWVKASNGLPDGPTRKPIVSGSDVFVLANGGRIYRTANQGGQWIPSPLPVSAWVESLAAVGPHLFAGTISNGMFYSSNRGESWQPVNNGPGVTRIYSLATTDSTVFAGVSGAGVFAASLDDSLPATVVSAASYQGTEIAPGSIVSVFGEGLATASESANSLPLPTTLAGTRVVVLDDAKREHAASLFFVSPSQINFLLPNAPELLAAQTATVRVISSDGRIFTTSVRNERVAPALFAANANGQGVASAVVLRSKANGERRYEPVARFDSALNRFVAEPIDLGPAGDVVVLVLFGSGFRHRNVAQEFRVQIGNQAIAADYAGAQGDWEGLDQINLRLPRTLMGSGELNLSVFVPGTDISPSNTVRINVK
ncbi:MAG: hypothetical protein JNJ50_21525 [Acidobacteria bacterium]|nr:hypothetical protein [Acidobacteriota bacterium]